MVQITDFEKPAHFNYILYKSLAILRLYIYKMYPCIYVCVKTFSNTIQLAM